MARRPPRLERIFEEYRRPLWFVTFCTHDRKRLLANENVHRRFCTFAENAARREIAVGRYVFMPDHLHLFVAGSPTFELDEWVRILKLSLSSAIHAPRPHWQEGVFDHLIRHDESYAEKWRYVEQNPVRAGLASTPEEWPFQGEFMRLPFD